MPCPKCGNELEDAGVMHSGNSKFSVRKCSSCGHEEMRCLGLA